MLLKIDYSFFQKMDLEFETANICGYDYIEFFRDN